MKNCVENAPWLIVISKYFQLCMKAGFCQIQSHIQAEGNEGIHMTQVGVHCSLRVASLTCNMLY